MGFTGGANVTESDRQGRRREGHGLNPCVGKIPRRREWTPNPVFLPGKPHRQRITKNRT